MYNQKMNPSMDRALRAHRSACIAFMGAGGKTTALFELARSMQPPVIVTATSHLGAWQAGLADRHIMTDTPAPLEGLAHGLQGVILITGELEGDRTRPVHDRLLRWLHEFCGEQGMPLLIEADGSRQKPLKAWAGHEPAVPSFADQVVQVAGLSGLGKPLQEEFVHRPGIFSALAEMAINDIVTPEAVVKVLTAPSGGLKNVPGQAHRLVLLNQADTSSLQAVANGMVRPLLAAYDAVIVSSLMQHRIFAVHEPAAAVVLAAGESSRYGKIKQLLDWRGEPFVRAVARTAREAGCCPVLVVTGAHADQVEAALEGLDVQVVHNQDWREGQASSIRMGVLGMVSPVENVNSDVGFGGGACRAEGAGSAIFLLADQPQITASILRALIEKHAAGLYPIVAPMVMDRRANPVLFDRSTFQDLLSIQGDVGGRAIFHKHQVEYLPWHDDRLLLDVDTPEMYQRLISDETL